MTLLVPDPKIVTFWVAVEPAFVKARVGNVPAVLASAGVPTGAVGVAIETAVMVVGGVAGGVAGAVALSPPPPQAARSAVDKDKERIAGYFMLGIELWVAQALTFVVAVSPSCRPHRTDNHVQAC